MKTNILSSGSVTTIDPSTPSTSSEVQDKPLAVPQIGAPSIPTVPPTASIETGSDVEGIDLGISNAEFISAVFQQVPEGAFPAICSKPGDPTVGGWRAKPADSAIDFLSAENNNFINCSSFYPGADESFKARKENFAACHFLMLDDLGTKVPLERLAGFELSWLTETSPGNFQGGIILADPITDRDEATNLHKAIIDAGLCDPGASGALSRWARLPDAINGKPKHTDENGAPFRCRLVEWRPEKRYSPQEIVDGLKLQLNSTKATQSVVDNQGCFRSSS